MMTEPRMTMVTLAAEPGQPKVTVEAQQFGDWWAMTPSTTEEGGVDPRYMAVTHIPSGRSVGPWGFHNHELVRQLAVEFAQRFDGSEWGHQNHQDIPEAARAEAAAVYEEWLDRHQHALVSWADLLGGPR